MAFSVDGLPAGLRVDPESGVMSGAVQEAGTYPVVLHARNAKGAADRKFRIVVGNDISLTPPMGWNSWNCWAKSVNQEKVLRSAKAMVDSGLTQHGWSYVNIDDTWQGMRTGKEHALQANEKFPDMKGLCDTLHKMGLKAGIYSTPWMTSYANFAGGTATNPEGVWVRESNKKVGRMIGQYSFAKPDAQQWADWGFDYLKYDWREITPPVVAEMDDALRATGRDIVLSLSNTAPYKTVAEYGKIAQAWRTTGDINDSWEKMSSIGFGKDNWAPYAKPGHWNDPDMLVIGWVGWGPNLHPTKLTADEQYTHISLWCLLSAPLLIGCDMDKLDAFTLGLLTNDEVLAIDQDALGKQATRVSGDEAALTDVYAKPLEDGSQAVGLFNRGKTPATVKISWSDLHLTGNKQNVRDLWRQKDLGAFNDGFSAEVAPHGVLLVRLQNAK
jgi:alpha-galactosidase